MAVDNKILYGLKNLYYAIKTDEGYETPVAIPGAVNIELTPSGDSSTFYADDIAYAVFSANNGYEGTLEVANFPKEFMTDVLNFAIDEDGNLVETTFLQSVECALLFEFTGDIRSRRHIFWDVKFSRPNVSGATKEESIEPQAQSIDFVAIPLASGVVKSTTTNDTETQAYNNWFTTAPVPPEIDD